MKQSEIMFDFDERKLKAINLYLDGKDGALGSELQNFMETLYRKNVPAQVREYIERLEKSEPPEQARSAKTQRKPPSPTFGDAGGFPETEGNARPKL